MKLFGIAWGAQRREVRDHDSARDEAPKIDPGAAGRALAELACLAPRERVKARARLMRAQMGLPPLPALEPRTGCAKADQADTGTMPG
jgi:hypothetical protein